MLIGFSDGRTAGGISCRGFVCQGSHSGTGAGGILAGDPSQRRERSDSYGGTKKALEKMREKLDAGELETDEQIREAISQCEEELEITLTEEQKEQLLGLIQKMNALGLNSDEILSKAQELYEEYGEQIKKSADAAIQENIVEPVKEAVVEGTKSAIRDFFRDMGESIRSFFARLFS